MALLTCTDSVSLEGATYVKDQQLVLGYINGAWATYDELVKYYQHTNVKVLSVSVFGDVLADIYDCENGNYTPVQAAQVLQWSLKQGHRPTAYGSQYYLLEVAAELAKLKINKSAVDWWLADYVQVASWNGKLPLSLPSSPFAYVGWQFADSVPTRTGHTFDVSVVSVGWAERHGWKPAAPGKSHVATGLHSIAGSPLIAFNAADVAPETAKKVYLPAGWYELNGTAVKVG